MIHIISVIRTIYNYIFIKSHRYTQRDCLAYHFLKEKYVQAQVQAQTDVSNPGDLFLIVELEITQSN